MAQAKKEDQERPPVHPLQRAWAGGVFDARVRIAVNGYVLRFEGTDEALIRRFRDTVGVGKVHEHPRPPRKDWIYLTSNADDTRTLLLFVAPFLSGHRMNAAAAMIARIEGNERWRKEHPDKVANLVTPQKG
jgi:hypothetical protein